METGQTISIHASSATKVLNREFSIIDALSGLFSATKTTFSSVYGYLKEMLWYRPREIPNETTLRELEENKKAVENGYVSPTFDSVDKMLDWLYSPSKKYQNGVRTVD